MKLSIIIPVYNAADVVCRTLDSIYSQGLDPREFEVICVDDCSTDNTPKVLEEYAQRLEGGGNLCIVRHTVNKRQGGARNTAIKMAKGDWILHLDSDDFFLDGTLGKLLAFAEEHPDLDTVMFDCGEGADVATGSLGNYSRQHLDERVMTGEEFLQRIPVPWVLWCYMYRREHLLQTGFFFEENTHFEDTDFVLKYTARSKAICFLPLTVVFHTIHPNQSTGVNDDPNKIREVIRTTYRVFDAATKEKFHSLAASKAIMWHASYGFRLCLKRFVWRLPSYKDIKAILSECRFTEPTGDRLVDFANRHITLVALALTVGKPFLYAAARTIRFLRRK